MRTDELITALATRAEPVDSGAPSRRLLLAAVAGAVLGVPLMMARLGINPGLAQAAQLSMFWVKLAFVVAVAAAAFALALRLAKPGTPTRRATVALSIPFALIWLLAAVALATAAPGERGALVMGSTWQSCPLNIAQLSAPAFVLAMWAMRGLAPTRLPLAGAAAGLLAGALGATVYTLHCPELAAPFIGLWYVLGMLLPAAAGALLGRVILRW